MHGASLALLWKTLFLFPCSRFPTCRLHNGEPVCRYKAMKKNIHLYGSRFVADHVQSSWTVPDRPGTVLRPGHVTHRSTI